jgi:hypothetical protein
VEWKGLLGFPPLELEWKTNFPECHPVRARPINPKLWDVAEKEFNRLCRYMIQTINFSLCIATGHSE